MEKGTQGSTDTIVALSTPRGFSGIGVVRISGPDVRRILGEIVTSRKGIVEFRDRKAVYGLVHDPFDGTVLDDGIAVLMEGPSTYTGEDVGELSLHGSPNVLDAVVRTIVRLGARPAVRGEFTRRSFLAGKLDLVQAEAVIDLIESPTLNAAKEARARLENRLSNRIHEISNAIKDLLSEVEAYIDFDEDDNMAEPQVTKSLQSITEKMQHCIDSGSVGRVLREGLKAVIVGKPNVGKSTLFNALVDEERTIVTPYPGTTRDSVEERIVINGQSFVLTDTAGLRENPEPIEAEGIRRTRLKMEEADVVIAVFDATEQPDADDRRVLDETAHRQRIVVLNKIDLECPHKPEHSNNLSGTAPSLPVSGKTRQGLPALREALCHLAVCTTDKWLSTEQGCLNDRATLLMTTAKASLDRLSEELSKNSHKIQEFVSYELRESLGVLEEITGERVDEGILERVFERFCVGK